MLGSRFRDYIQFFAGFDQAALDVHRSGLATESRHLCRESYCHHKTVSGRSQHHCVETKVVRDPTAHQRSQRNASHECHRE